MAVYFHNKFQFIFVSFNTWFKSRLLFIFLFIFWVGKAIELNGFFIYSLELGVIWEKLVENLE